MNLEDQIRDIANAKQARRIARAKSMSNTERLMEGFELYEETLERMKAGIRFQHPDMTEEQVLKKLNENMKIIRDSEKMKTLTP